MDWTAYLKNNKGVLKMGESYMAYHPDPYIRNYDDRGMAKWLGFYLSEHTSEMEKDSILRNKVFVRKQAMSEGEISHTLEFAFKQRKSVTIQLATLNDEGAAFPDIEGIIEGYQGNQLYISDLDAGIQIVAIDTISHVVLSDQEKWSEIS